MLFSSNSYASTVLRALISAPRSGITQCVQCNILEVKGAKCPKLKRKFKQVFSTYHHFHYTSIFQEETIFCEVILQRVKTPEKRRVFFLMNRLLSEIVGNVIFRQDAYVDKLEHNLLYVQYFWPLIEEHVSLGILRTWLGGIFSG